MLTDGGSKLIFTGSGGSSGSGHGSTRQHTASIRRGPGRPRKDFMPGQRTQQVRAIEAASRGIVKRVRGMGIRGGGAGMSAKRKQLVSGSWSPTNGRATSASNSPLTSPTTTTPLTTASAAATVTTLNSTASASPFQQQQSSSSSVQLPPQSPDAHGSSLRCTPASTPTSEDGGTSSGDFSGFGSASISGGLATLAESPNTTLSELTANVSQDSQQATSSSSAANVSNTSTTTTATVPYNAVNNQSEKSSPSQSQHQLQEELPYFPEKWPGKVCALCCLGERSHLGQGEMLRLELGDGPEQNAAEDGGNGSNSSNNGSGDLSVTPKTAAAAAAAQEEKNARSLVSVLGAGPQLSNRRQKGHNKCK